jgi:hypothetical protein
MESKGWNHSRMSSEQRTLQAELRRGVAEGTMANTQRRQDKISYKALVTGGVPKPLAAALIIKSRLHNANVLGVIGPSRIPGSSRSSRGG